MQMPVGAGGGRGEGGGRKAEAAVPSHLASPRAQPYLLGKSSGSG